MRNPLPQLSPRLSITYALSDRTDVSANVGRYAKLPSYTTLGYRNAEGELANRDALKYIISNHLVVGVRHRPIEGLSLVAEAFYKTYEHYPVSLAEDVSLASKGVGFGVVGDEAVTASVVPMVWRRWRAGNCHKGRCSLPPTRSSAVSLPTAQGSISPLRGTRATF